ncbi:MAG: FKBP-type peptidyl-prolyl cis-trans isomerase [Chitinophagaceae bacterium]|jgi:FKBP-type peptidyl-prolyl cis-trans isomerase FkpA|nr:FKBP-type peptidyl-prolyl cis-trans isomerase [Chitinophagaceae bacterium]
MIRNPRINKWTALLAATLFAMALSLAGCEKQNNQNGCTNADPNTEEAAIQAFIKEKGINATKHSRGVYYEIVHQGSTVGPRQTSFIYCTYKGTRLDGVVFDEQSNPGRTGFQLNGLIEAWKICLPLIGKGGTIKMVLPSALGYGCNGGGEKIPPNTPLYFEVTLVDFFN